jgi:thioredoxin-like negative regulator of GroEL
LIRATLKDGNLDEAQRHLDVLKHVFTPKVEGWTLQGILSMQRQNFFEAKHAFEQALAIVGENIKARMGLGMACLGLGQSAEAWNIFEQVVSGAPDNVEAIRCLMQAGTALQRWEVLSGRLARFVERNPADCDMRFALAGVQFRAGQSEQAKEHVTWLRLIKPDYEGLEDLEKLLQSSQSPNNLVSTR